MTEAKVRKRRSQGTYRLGIASSSGQGNEAVASKAFAGISDKRECALSPFKDGQATAPATWSRTERRS